MAGKKYRVLLTSEERNDLTQLTSHGKIAARKLTHAQILLHADEESSKTKGVRVKLKVV